MYSRPIEIDGRIKTWWIWLTVALLLLLPIDLLMTLAAVSQHGLAVEANPLVRWLLSLGLLEVTVANIAVGSAAVYMFHAAVGGLRRAPASRHRALVYGVDAWVALMLVAGIVLTVNNLLVIV